ncbi:PD-(D/E)XK nuclease family protein [Ottowia sp.]|uniref:PD-(D/E)XK nuclease family protein n=1 Tax=Ottowia sp. TaxID=1898956 RepID=UPI002BAF5B5C|nr:PD-(D/E)XK nuclease family protein [Ottowia sp.]HPZ55987.1 PD-(D/E)XK nuclease family protein [Ottowia sp.]
MPPAPLDGVTRGWRDLLARVNAQLRALAAHPARSVVLLPYAQLMPLAARLWAAQCPDGFAPRFETTRNWAARVGWFAPGPHDLTFDHGRDLLTAAVLLDGAGLAAQRALLAGPLVEQATQLGQIAASLPPALRPDWAEQARAALPPVGDGPLALEAAVGRIAIAWAGNSDYATDVLFAPRVVDALDALLIVPGLLPDPLTETLAEHYFEKAVLLNVQSDTPPGHIALHACADAEDEAERAAACVLRHIDAGRVPVALVAGDRVLTRRVNALLAERGVRAGEALRDETGWKLSTTHAAAQLMAALRASAPRASTDEVLDWLKVAPAFDAQPQRGLERRLRRDAVRGWPQAALLTADQALTQQIEALRAPMSAARPLADWLAALRTLLQGCGLWPLLVADVAGNAVIDALGLNDEALADWRDWPVAQRRMGLAEFTRWVGDALEAASFRPPHPADAQVVVLPMAQLLGRPFAALVLPGADEQRLPAAPEPPGPWSAAQRQALRLPTREDLREAQAAAWALALRVPQVDVLWRHADDNGEPLLPSPLVQSLQLQELAALGTEARAARFIQIHPTQRPQPRGDALPTQPLSASGYEMLRACPYRFFALRQLGLAEEGELDVDIDKRDWGNWLHDTLRGFHEALRDAPDADRLALIDAAAEAATEGLGPSLEPGEFMPFAVAWPTLRDAYLQWLAKHEASGARFKLAEESIDTQRGPLRLKGQIDRIDDVQDGAALLIDYKTEPLTRTRERVKAGNEDTQLPFYALLSGADAPRAAYLNLSERETPSLNELPDLPELAAQLYEGMAHDLAQIAVGEPLPALGEGSVCDWCDARGLCRKDFWSQG